MPFMQQRNEVSLIRSADGVVSGVWWLGLPGPTLSLGSCVWRLRVGKAWVGESAEGTHPAPACQVCALRPQALGSCSPLALVTGEAAV